MQHMMTVGPVILWYRREPEFRTTELGVEVRIAGRFVELILNMGGKQ